LLGTRLKDMTSGYQAFNSETVKLFLNYPLKSKAHFYQTEIKYLLREKKFMEIPITYKVPSSNLRSEAVSNSIYTLLFYFKKRISLKPVSL
jgi:dolichol-phosphate mannosyltransferase